MEKIRGRSLQEWKEYCSSENVPVKTMKYIICLEERIAAISVTRCCGDIVCVNCDGYGYTVDEEGRRKDHCKECD